jgi:[acyl-carrier-protein] S-malonyltransferase
MRNLLVFPGQGSQYICMGKTFSENFIAARDVFNEVDESLSQSLSKIMWDGDIEELTKTENAQPAIMSASIAIFRVLENEIGIDFSKIGYCAGHSLGEYSALVATKSLELATAAKLLKLRGISMQKAVPIGQGAMAALIGSSIEEVEQLIKHINDQRADLVCNIANDNAPGQVVISGHIKAIDAAIELSANFGAKKALKLPVSAPFHCSLMQPAADVMNEALGESNIIDPIIPIIANVNAMPETQAKKITELLVRQVTGRVRWVETIKYAKKNGIEKVFEIGAGKVLTGLAKRIDSTMDSHSIEVPDQIDSFILV